MSLSTGSYEDCAHKRDWCNACAFLMRHDTSHQLHVYTQEFIAVFGGGGGGGGFIIIFLNYA